jgi:hypothetical protein
LFIADLLIHLPLALRSSCCVGAGKMPYCAKSLRAGLIVGIDWKSPGPGRRTWCGGI